MRRWLPFERGTADTAASERREKEYENKSYNSAGGTVPVLALPVFFGYDGIYGTDPAVGVYIDL